MHKTWGESNTSSKVCSNLSEYILHSSRVFAAPSSTRKHLQWRSHFSYIFSRKVLIYGLALIQPINHVFQLQHTRFFHTVFVFSFGEGKWTDVCVSITCMRSSTIYVCVFHIKYTEYTWWLKVKNFLMPLEILFFAQRFHSREELFHRKEQRKNRSASRFYSKAFFLLYNLLENFCYYVNEVFFKERSKRLLSFVTGLASVLS